MYSFTRSHVVRRAAVAAAAVGAVAASALIMASPASAHATVQMYGGTAAAGGYGAMWIRIGHGCEGASPTKRVVVNIPASFGSAKPQMIGGWKARTILNADGSRLLVWKATGDMLPDDQFADFGISVKWPTTEGTVLIPTIQTCEVGKIAWIDPDHTAEHPAPSVVVGPAVASAH